ncbi:M20 family metallopeptidase [Nocardia asiatica]|uniref:M20 family metallopeptidase n=1 Tax=Nocardia asiatica TaxID=209252 RepID=UPI000A040E22|nr:M20/M25/M40 family metallo-hydrolase [Nocardia asiatica]
MEMQELLKCGRADAESVTELASALIRQPSRGGIDEYGPVLAVAETWLKDHDLPCRRLYGPDQDVVGLACEVVGGISGSTWVLDACLDTAPFGDESAWSFPPTAGDVADGWLRGRGSADSKSGAALFCHIAAAVAPHADRLTGTLAVLLDVDEHTGEFGGARAFLSDHGVAPIGGVLIGYPGVDEVVVGGRGVLRARVHVFGVAEHSGASRPSQVNAVSRAASLIRALDAVELPAVEASTFPLPPKLTVTGVHGGEGFSTVPDACVVSIDIRLTDALDTDSALKLLQQAAAELDHDSPGPRPTTVETVMSWPPFLLGEHDQPAAALLASAREAGIDARPKVAGPSNIGNLLGDFGIRATAGFGLRYQGLHGTDECVSLDALPAVHAAYHRCVRSLMDVDS